MLSKQAGEWGTFFGDFAARWEKFRFYALFKYNPLRSIPSWHPMLLGRGASWHADGFEMSRKT